MIARNAAALGVPGLQIVVGTAPQILAGLDRPDAIFVGGGIADPELLPALWDALRPGGCLVANVVSLAGERAVIDWQARHGGCLTRIAISHAEPLGTQQTWRPQLPVTQLARRSRMRTNAVWLVGWRPYALLAAMPPALSPRHRVDPPLTVTRRFAQATRQMLETGDFLRIRFQDEARNKPAGIYWLQAAAVAAFSTPGEHRHLALSPPVHVGALAAALLIFAIGSALLLATQGPAAGGGLHCCDIAGQRARGRHRGAYRQDRRGIVSGGGRRQDCLGLVYVRARTGRPACRRSSCSGLPKPRDPAQGCARSGPRDRPPRPVDHDRDPRWRALPGRRDHLHNHRRFAWLIAIERATEVNFSPTRSARISGRS
jgi:hypothetical protein